MTSQGQRFRRRALRRGYKVEEVDRFLDRVEATLNGDRIDSPVRSQEVHDVVFRVRFGGYDEWQVDLHLDRVERQLADQEPAAAPVGDRLPERGPIDRLPERIPERLPERIPERMSDRIPERMPHSGMGSPGMAGAGPGGPGSGGPGSGGPGSGGPGPGGPGPGGPGPSGPGLGGPGPGGGAGPGMGGNQFDRGPAGPPRDSGPGVRDDRMMPPGSTGSRPPAPAGPPPGWGDQGTSARPAPPGYQRAFERPESSFGGPDYGSDPYDNEPTYAGFEPGGRRGRPDLTTEMRMPDPQSPTAGPPPAPGAPSMGGGPAVPAGDVQRIDQLRRTFQQRRFGSGYDRAEVDRLFDGLINTMSGRSGTPVGELELDPQQFNLVPGGYFETEVDQALREVREIIRRR